MVSCIRKDEKVIDPYQILLKSAGRIKTTSESILSPLMILVGLMAMVFFRKNFEIRDKIQY